MQRDKFKSDEERIDALREAFQDRVGTWSLSPWTITEQEANVLLKHPFSLLFHAFTRVGTEVKRLRTEELVFLPQEEILEMLRRKINVEVKRQREAAQDVLTHRERHPASRVPAAKTTEMTVA